jgi:flagellin
MSAMGDIVLSAGVRQNLLALQNTAHLMSVTQNRLATGKKVNSALDNPTNFFTSQALQTRATDLNALLDSIGQAQKTLEAADQGLTSLTKLVESAKSIAKQAQQAPLGGTTTYNAINVTGTAATESKATITGSFDWGDGTTNVVPNAGNLDIKVGATTYNVGLLNTDKLQDVVDAINNTAGLQDHVVASIDSSNPAAQKLVITSKTVASADNFTIIDGGAGAPAQDLGFTSGTDTALTSTNLLKTIVDNGGGDGTSTLTVTVDGGTAHQIVFGTGAGQVETLSDLNTALQGLGITGLTASAGGASNTAISFAVAGGPTANALTLGESAGVFEGLGVTAGTTAGTSTTSAPDATRASLESDFNNVLSQIDALAKDASYNGINLLYGDNLKVVFNESGDSFLTIAGVTFDSAGLGLTAAASGEFQVDSNIDTKVSSLDTALVTLRAQASKFGSNLTTVQTRQDFTKNLINTLQTGADSLVLADTNEEGANMLALQTRQQLSTTALSLSAQADQAVLRLFG